VSQGLLLGKSILVFWLIYTMGIIGKGKVRINKIRKIMVLIIKIIRIRIRIRIQILIQITMRIRIQILIQIKMRIRKADKLLRICK